jgi:hypothetical protein
MEVHLPAVGLTALGVPRGHLAEVAAPVELPVVLLCQPAELLLPDALGLAGVGASQLRKAPAVI